MNLETIKYSRTNKAKYILDDILINHRIEHNAFVLTIISSNGDVLFHIGKQAHYLRVSLDFIYDEIVSEFEDIDSYKKFIKTFITDKFDYYIAYVDCFMNESKLDDDEVSDIIKSIFNPK